MKHWVIHIETLGNDDVFVLWSAESGTCAAGLQWALKGGPAQPPWHSAAGRRAYPGRCRGARRTHEGVGTPGDTCFLGMGRVPEVWGRKGRGIGKGGAAKFGKCLRGSPAPFSPLPLSTGVVSTVVGWARSQCSTCNISAFSLPMGPEGPYSVTISTL